MSPATPTDGTTSTSAAVAAPTAAAPAAVAAVPSTTTSSTTVKPKVWLITGCSSGLGRELALAALERGDKVIATARRVAALEDLARRGAHTAALDVTSSDEVVQRTIAGAIATFGGGRIDVLINNAGYSLVGGVEETSTQEVLDILSTNVVGIYKTVRAVLPTMRAQQSGVIANIGSSVGRMGIPAAGAYCASKFAVAGLTEALRAEVAPLGIDVTCVDLGMFRTSFGSNSVRVQQPVADCSPVVAAMVARLSGGAGKKPGDPAKGARAIVDVLTRSGRCADKTALPVRLAVGSDTVPFIGSVLARDEQELREWAELVAGTDHDDVVAA